jgi:hypothetical protein
MFGTDTRMHAPGLKVALLSGGMAIALVGCGQVLDGDPVALLPVADMTTAIGPDVAGAPAPIAPGHPDRATVGGGPGTGSWQTDVETLATGRIGAFTDDFAVDPTGVVGPDGQVTASDDPGVTDAVDDADRAAVDAEGAQTVGADGQVTTPGGVATDDDAAVEAAGSEPVGADGQVTTTGDVARDDDTTVNADGASTVGADG